MKWIASIDLHMHCGCIKGMPVCRQPSVTLSLYYVNTLSTAATIYCNRWNRWTLLHLESCELCLCLRAISCTKGSMFVSLWLCISVTCMCESPWSCGTCPNVCLCVTQTLTSVASINRSCLDASGTWIMWRCAVFAFLQSLFLKSLSSEGKCDWHESEYITTPRFQRRCTSVLQKICSFKRLFEQADSY